MPTTLITGASRGIGLEAARQLTDQGHDIILTGRDQSALDKAAASLPSKAQTAILDVGSDTSVAELFAELQANGTRLDVLINNAGRYYDDRPGGMDTTADDLLEALNNNAVSAWRMMQHAIPMMNAQGYGRIVNVSSAMGQLAELCPDAIPYRVSKATMNALTLSTAATCGPDVKVNAISPGWVRTDMGGPNAPRSVEEGARGIVWAATLPPDGPSGGFFRDGKPLDW